MQSRTTVPQGAALPSRRLRRREAKRQRRRVWRNRILVATAAMMAAAAGLVWVGFGTPWGNDARLVLAETIISTRHAYLARYITTDAEYRKLMKQLNPVVVNSQKPDLVQVQPVSQAVNRPVVEIQPVSGDGYTGYVMLVHNPRLVRLVPARVVADKGEYVTDMLRRTGAVAGTNASGFEDPKGEGWGGVPVGLEYVDGKVLNPPQPGWTTVGFTKDGVLVMGDYTVTQLRKLGVRDAMQFHPELVVDGKPMITEGDGGWGYAPRTAIGQAKDGTVIFVVINGRFHGGAGMGASQRQVMDLMLQYGAVNACSMDGGSSSVLAYNGKVVNAPSTLDPNGQRHLPDAWLVFPTEASADLAQAPAGAAE
ncbi:MAG: phosphodiester glycosidase family protein [Alicyclobacillus macrosporangiidus]|uniref:phosphodiester glycosidase family protein n=1 Tax=Alicyclobacillus macrosporangiidus TaxID=392015 RepID=UPI0026EDBBA7|nr:phosphodiester glycosidase family protein [Alicyclobacillus macrosporangiidus]MCL6600931.1 phosphodiester glycosidase family protein [Alicyclobacillus macrosporangiidus]